ncbi:MAG TPA: hypothetical protein VFU75_09460 [Gemmatimonadales bacterium]|nr:hypothetical protein [Gemmatimonadales bacterium]
MNLSRHRIAVLLAAVGLALSCSDSPIGPGSTRTPVSVGDTVSGSLAAQQYEALYSFHAVQDSFYAAFLQAAIGGIALDVEDSTRSLLLEHMFGGPTPQLLDDPGPAFKLPWTGDFVVSVNDPGTRPGTTFRFLLYQVHTAPELIPPRFAIGDTVSGETLETSADVDRFVFAGTAGQEVVAYAQAMSGDSGRRLGISINAPGTPAVTSLGGDTSLEMQSTGRFTLPATGDYNLTVLGAPDLLNQHPGFHGPYRFQVHAVNHHPESVPDSLIPGDTVSDERLDYVGDIDEFRVAAPPGQTVNVFIQGNTGNPSDSFVVDLRHPADTGFSQQTMTSGADPNLLAHATGNFVIPPGSAPLIRVRGEWDRFNVPDRGPYRIFVYPVNAAPEHNPDSLVLNDSVGETIEVPGDIDTFRLTLPQPALVNYVLRRGPSTSTNALQLAISGPDSIVVEDPDSFAASGVALRPAGSYVLRMSGQTSKDGGYVGPYELTAWRIDTMPETAAESLAVGDTVTEPLEPLGDRDTYVFHGVNGQHILVSLEALTGVGYQMAVLDPAGALLSTAYVGANTGRIDLTQTGWYHIAIGPNNNGAESIDHGIYRFTIGSVSGAPEHSPDSVVVGDSISTESLDFSGDLDQFRLIGSPNQEVAVFFRTQMYPVTLDVIDTASLQVLASTITSVPTARFKLPASGSTPLIRVYGPGPANGSQGPYWLWVYPVNRAPESVPATVTLGDTVSGETINPLADVDEFQFAGTSGQVVTVLFDTPTGASIPGYQLQFVDASNDSVLAQVTSGNPSNHFGDVNTGPITLPRTGTYLVRVQAADYQAINNQPYKFLIQ